MVISILEMGRPKARVLRVILSYVTTRLITFMYAFIPIFLSNLLFLFRLLDLEVLDTRIWPLAENLTADSLKEVCNNVMIDRCDPWEPSIQWVQAYIPPEEGKLRERVTKHAQVLFEEGRYNMTVIRCVYKFFDFFLAEGDDKVIFKLDRDIVDNVYTFDCGPFRLRGSYY